MPPAEATAEKNAVDKRWKLVEATMRRNGYRPDALIETLHTVQGVFGYIDREALKFVAERLPVSPSQIFGVVTFYHYFQMKPQGKHTCSVCTGTACHIKGSKSLLDDIEAHYGLKDGQTTPDGNVSLLTVRCIGACGLAPAAVFDGEVEGNMTPDRLHERLDIWLAEEDDGDGSKEN
jgi:bidirectional [NiFe] hydrogenase diaphorase subunit